MQQQLTGILWHRIKCKQICYAQCVVNRVRLLKPNEPEICIWRFEMAIDDSNCFHFCFFKRSVPSILRNSNRYRRDQRQMDEEEEIWFNEDEDYSESTGKAVAAELDTTIGKC